MATNDFLVFGGGSSPNVIDQATYAALAARLSGFQSGTALSAQLNKVWRQSSIMAAVLAQFTANFSGQNSVDDGTTAALLANLQAAINAAGITAPQFDNSTKLATTAFVQRALGNFQGFTAYTTSQTLTASQSGSVINFWGGAASTITLPLAAAMPPGGAFLFNNTSAGANVTIAAAGSDTILAAGGNASIVLNPGDNLLITSAGGTQWVASGGSAQLRFTQSFGSSLGTNGYQKLPSGLILQWGQTPVVAGSGTATINYPIAFTNAFYGCVPMGGKTTPNQTSNFILNSLGGSLTQFQVVNTGANQIDAGCFFAWGK